MTRRSAPRTVATAAGWPPAQGGVQDRLEEREYLPRWQRCDIDAVLQVGAEQLGALADLGGPSREIVGGWLFWEHLGVPKEVCRWQVDAGLSDVVGPGPASLAAGHLDGAGSELAAAHHLGQ